MYAQIHAQLFAHHNALQKNENCVFGKVLVAYFKFESSGRGGIHAHGQCIQPTLQAKNLERLFAEGETMQQLLYNFIETFSCTYLPRATKNIPFSSG